MQLPLARMNLLNGLADEKAEWSTKDQFLSAPYVPRRVLAACTMQRHLKNTQTLSASVLCFDSLLPKWEELNASSHVPSEHVHLQL